MSHSGAEFDAKIYGARVTGAELPAMPSTEPRSSGPGTLAPNSVPASMAPS